MCPSSGDCWILISILPSWVHYHLTGPSFDALWACVSLYMSSHVHIVPNVLPRWLTSQILAPAGGRTQSPIAHFAYLCHMTGEELVFLSFLYIQLFELGVEIALNNRSAVTHHKVNVLKFPLWSRYSERTDDAFVLLICFCFFHLSRNHSSLSVDRLNS